MATSPDVDTLERETAEARARLAGTLERLTSPQTAQAVKQELTDYAQGLKDVGFCGGSTPYTHWMSRSDVLDCVRHFGFGDQVVLMDVPDNVRGPSILFAARRTKPVT